RSGDRGVAGIDQRGQATHGLLQLPFPRPENAMPEALNFIDVGSGRDARAIAVRAQDGAPPGLLWLGGFKSDMRGTKAAALARFADERGRALVRFDYSGHGESNGEFVDGTIGRWLEESLAVFAAFCRGPQVLIGSSMGGWLALLLARELRRLKAAQATIAGMVLIAPAVDFTEELMWTKFPPAVRQEIEAKGAWQRPSQYGDEPYPITQRLIHDARQHLL